ncbi:DUF1152 domain-containing protein [Streptomyces kunmingensis]|uniref:DUF1152 domain-containing protein n=1 Tax=Streptomyces kunmingensis TaxID=68225 RepID=A0ABU6CFP1_9ACTN|nr:DUF1152 domain-containing protein [Streptomyces kunmingensis]MEB3963524.1 DUF1152 domain-containing protein [Streptomyces kunmingensis]
MTRLIVAAGGGGDAVAAVMLHAALYGHVEQAVILTYAWERLLVDPLPGPRGPGDFTGLEPITPAVRAVSSGSRPVAPAGSTLPRLAAELPHAFALIDPRRGVEGITRQLDELVRYLAPSSIDLLDVGGDILARGDEPTLKSPLADALMLAACYRVDAPVRLLVAGPGLDGELPLDDLRDQLGAVVHTFTATDVESIGSVLEWHPSEATGMLAAAALGVRGICEVRDAGLPIELTAESPTVHEADLDPAIARNELARAIMATESLSEAEAHSRAVCGYSEIDYERNKAAQLGARPPVDLDRRTVMTRLDRFEDAARRRGVTHTTFRHLTEALHLNGAQREGLRQFLISSRPQQYTAPLWSLTRKPVPSEGHEEPNRLR